MPECRAEYERKGGPQPGDRIVRCHLGAGHYPQSCHEEAETGVRWWDIPPSLQLRRRTPDEQLAYWQDKVHSLIAEKHDLTARAERAEAAIERVTEVVEQVRNAIYRFGPPYDRDATQDFLADMHSRLTAAVCSRCAVGVCSAHQPIEAAWAALDGTDNTGGTDG